MSLIQTISRNPFISSVFLYFCLYSRDINTTVSTCGESYFSYYLALVSPYAKLFFITIRGMGIYPVYSNIPKAPNYWPCSDSPNSISLIHFGIFSGYFPFFKSPITSSASSCLQNLSRI